MELIVIGLNHKTAPIEIRERLAFPEEKMENGPLPGQIPSFVERKHDPLDLQPGGDLCSGSGDGKGHFRSEGISLPISWRLLEGIRKKSLSIHAEKRR